VQSSCKRCGFATSSNAQLCQACMLLAGLSAGMPRIALSGAGGSAARAVLAAAVQSLQPEASSLRGEAQAAEQQQQPLRRAQALLDM
jgi:hypothetical protein